MFVLDASLALAWVFEDEQTPAARRLLSRLTTEAAIVPALWRFEVANALTVGERRGRMDPAQVERSIVLFETLPIEVDRELPDPSRLIAVARRRRLSAYDASYLDLAARQGVPLATLDGALAAAARAEGVPAAAPGPHPSP